MYTLFSIWLKASEALQYIQRSSDASEQREAESYLDGAVTLADLESRERNWLQSH